MYQILPKVGYKIAPCNHLYQYFCWETWMFTLREKEWKDSPIKFWPGFWKTKQNKTTEALNSVSRAQDRILRIKFYQLYFTYLLCAFLFLHRVLCHYFNSELHHLLLGFLNGRLTSQLPLPTSHSFHQHQRNLSQAKTWPRHDSASNPQLASPSRSSPTLLYGKTILHVTSPLISRINGRSHAGPQLEELVIVLPAISSHFVPSHTASCHFLKPLQPSSA